MWSCGTRSSIEKKETCSRLRLASFVIMAEYLLKPLKQQNRPISSNGHQVLKVVENIEKPWEIGRIYPPGNIPLRLGYRFSAGHAGVKPEAGTVPAAGLTPVWPADIRQPSRKGTL
jgi:hypothetical protein